MTLYALGALTVRGYRLRTGDHSTDAGAVSGALVEAESLMEEELRRLLPLEEREESMRIWDDGRVYPKAYPLTEAPLTIDGRSLVGAFPDVEAFVGYLGSDRCITPRVAITYTGGFDSSTLPITLRDGLYDLARAIVADVLPVPIGATSVSVGDVSVSYGSPSSAGGVDALVPGLGARVKRYRNRIAA